jgi:hypothetical protein
MVEEAALERLDTHRSVGISHSDGNSFIPCRIDSKFHNDFYFDCLKSFEQLLNMENQILQGQLSTIGVNIIKIIQLLLFIVIFARLYIHLLLTRRIMIL